MSFESDFNSNFLRKKLISFQRLEIMMAMVMMMMMIIMMMMMMIRLPFGNIRYNLIIGGGMDSSCIVCILSSSHYIHQITMMILLFFRYDRKMGLMKLFSLYTLIFASEAKENQRAQPPANVL